MDLTIIIALILGLIALALVLFAIKVILSAFSFDVTTISDTLVFKLNDFKLSKVDGLIETRQLKSAAEAASRLFILKRGVSTHRAVDATLNFNLSALARLLTISEKLGCRLSNLAVVEDLFQTRAQLLKLLIDAKNAARKKTKSDIPDWAAAEFSSKIDDIIDNINTNQNTLRQQIKTIVDSLKSSSEQQTVTYH